ncbi:MAG: lipopolysaccharide exporter [Paraglaciecola sp.]
MSAIKKLFTSAAFSSGAKILQRVLGLISTLILARVLTPEDFALIAIVSLTLYFFDMLSQSGSEPYIVQKKQVSEDDLNTSWTLDLLLKCLVLILLLLLASPIAAFFSQPQLSFAFQVASIALIINALRNPGIILFKRDLDYKKLFYLALVQRLVTFIIVIAVALQWQSYWAFIFADLAGAAVFTIGTYLIHTYKPRLGLTNIKHQWRFSRWLLGKSIIGYLRSQIDTVLVAKYFSPAILGNYYMARDIAMLPAHNILGPAIEPLLADFKDYKDSPIQLGGRVTKVLITISFLVFPISVFLAAYPKLVVEVLLGEQWQLAAPILQIMSLLFFYFVYLLVIESALTAIGQVKMIFIFDFASLLFIAVSMLGLLHYSDNLQLLLWLRVSIGLLLTLIIGMTLNHYVPLNLGKLLAGCLLALVLSVVAYGLSAVTVGKLELHPIVALITSGGVFCLGYFIMLVLVLPTFMGISLQTLYRQYLAK